MNCRLANSSAACFADSRLTSLYCSSAVDHPSGLRALAEVLLVPAGGDVRLGAVDCALETAKITSLSDER